jgi:hypothetical protein
MISEHITRFKDYLTIRIMIRDGEMLIKGKDLKSDRYEHGIPYLEKDHVPIKLGIDMTNPEEVSRIRSRIADTNATFVEEPEEDTAEDMMNELEKIIQTNIPDSTDDVEDDDEVVIQQTLF